MAPRPSDKNVFINVPFDEPGEKVYLALVVGLVCLGLKPRCVLEVQDDASRLDRLIDLIGDCRYSIHDLSRVQRSTKGFRTPRFNMAFELGLTIGAMRATSTDHQWHVLEAVPHRLAQSLSDLGGYDKVLIHSNTIDGVFESLLEMFAARPGPPVSEVAPMRRVYKAVRRYRLAQLPKDVFKAHCFRKLSVASFLELKAIAPRNA